MGRRWFILIVAGIFLSQSGCLNDNFLEAMKRENTRAPFDPQMNHTVYFNISDTGQTGDYRGTVEDDEDSDYSNLPPQSFTDNGNGTIKDNVTGLLWTKCSMGENNTMDSTNDCSATHGKYSWHNAKATCENLVHGGRNDWRLPTFSELFSLVHFGKTGNDVVAIDEIYFPNTEFDNCYYQGPGWNTTWTIIVQGYGLTKRYWTSSLWTADTYAHFISFDDGYSNVNDITDTNYVRCVSGP